jgi:hypothetical protein
VSRTVGMGSLAATSVRRQADGAETDADCPVQRELSDFYPMKDRGLQWLARHLWLIQLGLIPLDGVLFWKLEARGWKLLVLLTPHLSVSVASILAYRCMERLRDHVLRRLWDRRVIEEREPVKDSMRVEQGIADDYGLRSAPRIRDDALAARGTLPLDEQYAAFIRRLGRRMNLNVWGALLGCAFAFIFYWFFPIAGFMWGFPIRHKPHLSRLHWPWRIVLTGDLALQALLVIVVGLIAWRLLVIAWEVWHLGADFDLRLQWQHPDKSGGLGPVGDLCFSIAAVWAVVAIYPTAWLLLLRYGKVKDKTVFELAKFTAHPAGASGRQVLTHLQGYTLGVLALTLAFAILTFFVPLYFVHRAMVRHRSEAFEHLDSLGHVIHARALVLETIAERNPEEAPAPAPLTGDPPTPAPAPDARSQAKDEVALLRDVYVTNAAIPAWPFDVKLLAKFFAATVVPLTGVTVWLPTLIGKLAGRP